MKIALLVNFPVERINTAAKVKIYNYFKFAKNAEFILVAPAPIHDSIPKSVAVKASFLSKLHFLPFHAHVFSYLTPLAIFKIFRAMLKIKPDIILPLSLWSMPAAYVSAKMLRKKVLFENLDIEYISAKTGYRFKPFSIAIKVIENMLMRLCDKLAPISETDCRKINELYNIPRSRMVVIPFGIDLEKFSIVQKETAKSKLELSGPIVLFTGKLDYRPNVIALDLIQNTIAPHVWKAVPDCTFIITGEPQPVSDNSKIVFTGYVDQIQDYINAADCCICPITAGSGIRTKLLEFLACNKPIVSTSLGAEGLLLRPSIDLMIADDMHQFSECIVSILRHTAPANLGEHGRALIERTYDWKAVVETVEAEAAQLLK